MKQQIIQLINISRQYVDGRSYHVVLDDLSLTVSQGEMVAIVGKSGSGKSTLLNILSLLDTDYSGDYILDGANVGGLSSKCGFDLRSEKIGYIFQAFNLIGELNAVENAEMPIGYLGVPKKKRRQIALNCLEQVGLKDHVKKHPHQLSGGEQQRVAIARALTKSPAVILADEPTGNLDVQTAESILDVLTELNAKGTTIILVTHDPDVAKRCSVVYELKEGRLYDQKG